MEYGSGLVLVGYGCGYGYGGWHMVWSDDDLLGVQ